MLGLPRRLRPAPATELPTELTSAGSRVVLPLPDGRTRSQVYDLLASISIEGAPAEELRGYLDEDFERFLLTWSLVRHASGRCLEIGANPYFTTVLLRELTQLDVTLTNFFGPHDTAAGSQSVSYRPIDAPGPAEFPFTYEHVNVEHDTMPFDDGSLDVVLFCEVIEHLLEDPLAALIEIKRVLRPGGQLVVTTPNVARLENVARLAAGANIYDPYSGYGPYGRHNREYTRHELHRVLTFLGFDVVDHFTADVHPHHAGDFVEPGLLVDLLSGDRRNDLGQYLFFVARNTGAAPTQRPSFLYRSLPEGSIVPFA